MPCWRTVHAAQKLIMPVEKYTPAMKRCTLSSRGVVSGCPRYICSEPPKRAIAATMNRQIRTTVWLVVSAGSIRRDYAPRWCAGYRGRAGAPLPGPRKRAGCGGHRGKNNYFFSRLMLALLRGREEAEVQRRRLGLRSRAAEVQEVGRAVRIAVDLVVGAQHRELGDRVDVVRVDGRTVEVRRAVEDARLEDELVDLVVGDVGRRVRSVLVHVGDQRRADGVDAEAVQP